eukprot:TRINITY_DN2233_c0_g1_i1.p1 TRINITY_DN2233_c0_g1~~TRINITY_DN2233_c0_g1_i1.p1  ORF type:complete len:141 (+),score=9.10 TRINITY_DN2233_c0_g1_i1:88-510(+)
MSYKHECWECYQSPVPCLWACCCQCCAFGNYHERMSPIASPPILNNQWICCITDLLCHLCIPCFSAVKGRLDAREKYGLKDCHIVVDVLIGCCCFPCSHCQVLQEVNHREAALGPMPAILQQAPKGSSMGGKKVAVKGKK